MPNDASKKKQKRKKEKANPGDKKKTSNDAEITPSTSRSVPSASSAAQVDERGRGSGAALPHQLNRRSYSSARESCDHWRRSKNKRMENLSTGERAGERETIKPPSGEIRRKLVGPYDKLQTGLLLIDGIENLSFVHAIYGMSFFSFFLNKLDLKKLKN